MAAGRPTVDAAPAASAAVWDLRGARLSLDRPVILGILNVTPDSFSDGGQYVDPGAAIEQAHRMVSDGADLVDIGAESTRPGAPPVSVRAEWDRLEPVLERTAELSVPVSVDTTKAEIARRSLDCGAAAINDVSALRQDRGIADLVAASGAGLILMHMRGEPRTMQEDVEYEDLLGEITTALGAAIDTAVRRGCAATQLVVDPGLGFGKSVHGNLKLLARLGELATLGRPILVGPSRKSYLGALLNAPVEERIEGTLASCVVALERGARLFRVHDVRAARRALDVAHAIRSAEDRTEESAPGAH
jgi:dihydropteroate synthase